MDPSGGYLSVYLCDGKAPVCVYKHLCVSVVHVGVGAQRCGLQLVRRGLRAHVGTAVGTQAQVVIRRDLGPCVQRCWEVMNGSLGVRVQSLRVLLLR